MSAQANSGVLRIVLLLLFVLLFGSPTYSRVIYVDDNATGANDGTSWENAYVYLSDALGKANLAETPFEIRIAQGLYRPYSGILDQADFDRRTTTFQLGNGVTCRGGYAGLHEADPNLQDIELYETTFSGDLNADDMEIVQPSDLSDETTRMDNCFHVVTINGPAVLEGVTITGGYSSADMAGGEDDVNRGVGGGVWLTGQDITIRDCVFQTNFAAKGGGGLYGEDADLTLADCRFQRNLAESASADEDGRGGGMLFNGTNAVIINCVLTENVGTWGGGICSENPGYVESVNCLMTGNTAHQGGAVFYSEGGLVQVVNCTAVGNHAPEGCFLMDISPRPRREQPPWINLENCVLANGSQEVSNSFAALSVQFTDIVAGDAAISDPRHTMIWGAGNMAIDPLFADPGYWADVNDPNVAVEPNAANAVWINGDYHLQSRAGRYDSAAQAWVQDSVISPGIDAGHPATLFESEPSPNGIRINLGAYGGTTEASMSPTSWWFSTTQGPIPAEGLGLVLPHEHIFTDLRGPTTPGYAQADAADVVRVMAPLLEDAHHKGVGLLFECSSIGVGRNVPILAQVADASGLPVVVPTGVYGRANFAPPEHRIMTEDELAALFIKEIREGIRDTGIKAGFIKIATDNGPLTVLQERILRAAGRAARETGSAIASHTTTGNNALQQIQILESMSPTIRFIWVHAQNESTRNLHRQMAARGAYIEFDALGWNPGQDTTLIGVIKDLLVAGFGDRILLSHDAGWYRPGEPNGGTQKPYTYLGDSFVPKLKNAGLDDATIRMLTETNPIRAFGFRSNE